MKLVAKNSIFRTVQGEGVWVGTPSIFVRLWGCNDSCSWCDTKDSWKPGSKSIELSVEEIIEQIVEIQGSCLHLVVTGGNPLLQGDEVQELLRRLADNFTTTIETQASIYHSCVELCDLLSVSPKLHQWPKDFDLDKCLRSAAPYKQVKIVVDGIEATSKALGWFKVIDASSYSGIDAYILQPEFSGGVQLSKVVCELAINNELPITVREKLVVIPQVHKSLLGVP